MKVLESKRKVDISEDIQTYDFTLEVSAKTFRAVMTNYSCPISAVIREYSTNALDSHIESGNKDKQFDVHIPTKLEPFFYVRDYGTGLDLDELKDVYICIFKSTRENSNDYVGCRGLGSKAAFSYTDSFTVQSWKDGYTYICNMYESEDGTPKMAVLHQGTSDEPNGVKVTVNTKDDYYLWQDKAEGIYNYFTILPNCVGYKVDITPPSYVLESSFWKIKNSGKVNAVMGNIAYPISGVKEHLPEELRSLVSSPIDIYFEIGELTILDSREGLRYNNFTVTNIAKKLKQISDELGNSIRDFIQNSSCLWEARLNTTELYKKVPQSVISNLPQEWKTYNGHVLFDSYGYPNGVELIYDGLQDVKQFTRTSHGNSKMSRSIHINPNNVALVENDLIRGGQSRCRYLAERNGGRVVLLTFADGIARRAFLDRFGILESYLTKASTLPKKPSNRSSKSRSVNKIENVTKFVNNHYKDSRWTPCTRDMSLGGYYIELHRYQVVIDGEKVSSDIIPELLDFLKNIFGISVELYGVKKHVVPTLNDKWINIMDYARQKADEYNQKNPLALDYVTRRRETRWKFDKKQRWFLEYLFTKDNFKPLEKLKALYYNVNIDTHLLYLDFCKLIKHNVSLLNYQEGDISKASDSLREKHPTLDLMLKASNRTDFSHQELDNLVDYLNYLENKND